MKLLFESGFRRAEDLSKSSSRSKIGHTIQMQKAAGFLRAAIRMAKKMNAMIKSVAPVEEKEEIDRMIDKVSFETVTLVVSNIVPVEGDESYF